MSRDLALLEAVTNKKDYDSIVPYIKRHSIEKVTHALLTGMGEYYTATSKTSIDIDDFMSWFFTVKHHATKPELMHPYEMVFKAWEHRRDDLDVDATLIRNNYVRLEAMTRVMNIAMTACGGDEEADFDEITSIIDEYNAIAVALDDPDELDANEVAFDLEVAADTATDGFEWRLEELNKSCGLLRKGNFVEVGAFVDTGKTTFFASEATHMAQQLTEPEDYVLWINNEEEGLAVMQRIMSAALGVSGHDLDCNPIEFNKKYEDLMGTMKRIRLLDSASPHYKDIDKILKRLKPKLIIIDLLDKVKGFENDKANSVEKLQKIYQWGREVAKTYGPVIAGSQCTGDAVETKWIPMEMLKGSREAKQGEADAIITVGRLQSTEEAGFENRRYINIPKNKMRQTGRMDTAYRNGKWEVFILPEVARYDGLEKRP